MASEDPWFCETLTYQLKNFGDENFGPKKKVKNVSLFYKLKDFLQKQGNVDVEYFDREDGWIELNQQENDPGLVNLTFCSI